MVDKQIIVTKLKELEIYLLELDKFKKLALEDIAKDLEKRWAIEHGLQLAIQIVIDVGNHILAEIGENRIEDYTDIIDNLAEKDIIPVDFAKNIRGMIGFRNILVHEYITVDTNRLYEVLQNRTNDFKKFSGYIKEYLKST